MKQNIAAIIHDVLFYEEFEEKSWAHFLSAQALNILLFCCILTGVYLPYFINKFACHDDYIFFTFNHLVNLHPYENGALLNMGRVLYALIVHVQFFFATKLSDMAIMRIGSFILLIFTCLVFVKFIIESKLLKSLPAFLFVLLFALLPGVEFLGLWQFFSFSSLLSFLVALFSYKFFIKSFCLTQTNKNKNLIYSLILLWVSLSIYPTNTLYVFCLVTLTYLLSHSVSEVKKLAQCLVSSLWWGFNFTVYFIFAKHVMVPFFQERFNTNANNYNGYNFQAKIPPMQEILNRTWEIIKIGSSGRLDLYNYFSSYNGSLTPIATYVFFGLTFTFVAVSLIVLRGHKRLLFCAGLCLVAIIFAVISAPLVAAPVFPAYYRTMIPVTLFFYVLIFYFFTQVLSFRFCHNNQIASRIVGGLVFIFLAFNVLSAIYNVRETVRQNVNYVKCVENAVDKYGGSSGNHLEFSTFYVGTNALSSSLYRLNRDFALDVRLDHIASGLIQAVIKDKTNMATYSLNSQTLYSGLQSFHCKWIHDKRNIIPVSINSENALIESYLVYHNDPLPEYITDKTRGIIGIPLFSSLRIPLIKPHQKFKFKLVPVPRTENIIVKNPRSQDVYKSPIPVKVFVVTDENHKIEIFNQNIKVENLTYPQGSAVQVASLPARTREILLVAELPPQYAFEFAWSFLQFSE